MQSQKYSHKRHIQGCLNVIADSLSRKEKVIQTELYLHSSNFQSDLQSLPQTNGKHVCHQNESQTSTLCLTSSRCKCTEHSYIEHLMRGSERLCLFSCSSHSKSHSKMNTYKCKMILVAQGGPGMHRFWDVVHLSTKLPFNFLTGLIY